MPTPEPGETNGLAEPVRRHRERHRRWSREGERSLGRNLAWIGGLGWLIVVPILAGMFIGRWIDRHFGSGVFWTVSLLTLGVAVGCYLAWRRMQED